MDRSPLIRLMLVAVVFPLVVRRWLAYRRGVRAGTQPRSRTFERSGRLTAWGLALMLAFGALLPARLVYAWPRLWFYIFFALFLAGGALLLAGAVLYMISAPTVDPSPPSSGGHAR